MTCTLDQLKAMTEDQLKEHMQMIDLRVSGYIDEHPLYGNDGNWNTQISIGDILVVAFTGFGSEVLEYGHRYKVIERDGEICLSHEDGEIINAWHTRNTMPFFLKLRRQDNDAHTS